MCVKISYLYLQFFWNDFLFLRIYWDKHETFIEVSRYIANHNRMN
jgi:hypothetical protein